MKMGAHNSTLFSVHLICKICMFIAERKTFQKYSQLPCRKGSSLLLGVYPLGVFLLLFWNFLPPPSKAFLPWQHIWLWGGLLPAFSPMLSYNTSSLHWATSASNLLDISALISEALGLWLAPWPFSKVSSMQGCAQKGHLLTSLWVPHCPAAQEPNHTELFLDSAFLMEATCGCVPACMCL